jgi:hypothetical protein
MEPYILFYSRGEVKQPMPQTIRSNINFNSHNNSYGGEAMEEVVDNCEWNICFAIFLN